jgi:hypothetical protein
MSHKLFGKMESKFEEEKDVIIESELLFELDNIKIKKQSSN